jgi:protein-tyrosine phosphatase
MVCLGNICRSPMAEGILRSRLSEVNAQVLVDSAGTSEFHSGDHPDPRAISTLRKKKIDISGLAARQFTINDFDEFDLIYVMDSSNLMNVLSLARNEQDKQKVKMLMDEVSPSQNVSVPDPYYGDNDGFQRVYEMIDSAAQKIALRFK